MATVGDEKPEVAPVHTDNISDLEKRDVTVAAIPAFRDEHSDDGKALHTDFPTDEELVSLRRVAAPIPWLTFTIAFVELCERFSYYGTTVVFVNFIQRPLPEGSTTGASGPDGIPGALDMGQRASTGLTLFNNFWSYVMPLLGAYMADEHWGRFNTIMVSIGVALVGHTILIVSAIPAVIAKPGGSIACFSVGLVIMGIGTGGFKSNISALIAEQYKGERMFVKTLKSGERVIVDHAATVSRIYHYFYLMINVGALIGQISMVFAEKYVGFWLSFTLPTCMFCLCPLVLYFCRNRYARTPPAGSVYSKAFRVWGLAMKGRFSINPVRTYRNFTDPTMWDSAKPSKIANKPVWMTFDDAWVDEVRRGLMACRVFLWYPVFWLAYNQMTNNLTSQAATMTLNGVPNEIVNNLNPLTLIIAIPLMDRFVYPGLRKIGFNPTPLRRITAGFFLAAFGMVSAAVVQHYIYKTGPCGKMANDCAREGLHSPINVWIQSVSYILGGISEIFASVTSLEYAFTKAPANMRSLVQAVALFMNAFSAALGQALVSLSEDPLLVWNYTTVGILAALGGCGFWLTNQNLDKEEDALNVLPESGFTLKPGAVDAEKAESS
ncbi:hypothetical protein AJ80_08541 [Polytolypa hystricis UAMH7299]|uniref:POT family proton-dependent oligopeptide transporter n=1 Tax=Polytolypa hystricis (strain UAMH7299) TaxID=1447883 RepID=A0A2B7X6M7_POLH7|nr:hypothetical protein AJ80_08541 [Polytolypa hystricis UAMH7299]